MKNIKDFKGRLSAGSPLYDVLKKEYKDFFEKESINPDSWFHVVYQQHDNEIIVIWFNVLPKKINIKHSFIECLERIDCHDFNQVLIFLTLFPWYTGKSIMKKIMTPVKSSKHPLDFLLAATNGWILYRQQLEMIFQLSMRINGSEALQLRKDYNAGRVDIINTFDNYCLFGENLTAIIQKRCITKIVRDPLYHVNKALLLLPPDL